MYKFGNIEKQKLAKVVEKIEAKRETEKGN